MVTGRGAGRPARRPRELVAWMNGEEVGLWSISSKGTHSFAYADSWRRSKQSRPLSLSMPMTTEPVIGDVVVRYFENLLPDRDDFRRALRDQARLSSTSEFDLLFHYGKDCAGALVLLPRGEAPTPTQAADLDPMSEKDVAALIRQTATAPATLGGALRLSLAGAQSKTALTWANGCWNIPCGTTPTTHIVKLPMGAVGMPSVPFDSSVDNEHVCAVLLDELGLSIAATEIVHFEDQRVLSVERFDRQVIDGLGMIRLPQEDFCQALGYPRSQKYEQDGGPGIKQIDDVLRFSSRAAQDRVTFLKTNILFWLLCAPDGHAKNFSLKIEAGGGFRLTKLYDVMSIYPVLGKGAGTFDVHRVNLAMAPPGTKNRHFAWTGIMLKHWEAAAKALKVDIDVRAYVEALAGTADAKAQQVVDRMPPDIDRNTLHRTLDYFTAATKKAVTGAPLRAVVS